MRSFGVYNKTIQPLNDKTNPNVFASRGCKSTSLEGFRDIPECNYSCCKLGSHNWLKKVPQVKENHFSDFVEVRFKNGRKEIMKSPVDDTLEDGDIVAVEGSPGHDIGIVSLSGQMVKFQMKAKKVNLNSNDIRKVYRKAKLADIDKWASAINQEKHTMLRSREIASDLGLAMKISDVEMQGDKTKATFYYTADERVDFRELIRVLAETFSVRVEMRQVGMRQEASRVGGIGTCGRELCCSTWLTNFRSVSTNAARNQQLSLNPTKLSGQCNKLKCCINFENDCYTEQIKNIPAEAEELVTKKGVAYLQKTDVLRGLLGYSYKDNPGKIVMISFERVKEIKDANIRKVRPDDLLDINDLITVEDSPENNQADIKNNLEGNLNRFDNVKPPSKKKKRRKKNKPRTQTDNN
jgi:cell fate regulator YaaT (PSP1 superfamily)